MTNVFVSFAAENMNFFQFFTAVYSVASTIAYLKLKVTKGSVGCHFWVMDGISSANYVVMP